ncbi:MAG: hypothetical protein FJ088_00270, partial [Deltaproteobacteria bacterium]|nr:hypothetical protein [Deltaproteobacteria bacterium]
MRRQDGKLARFLLPFIIATLLQYPLIKLLVYQSPDTEVSRVKTGRFSGKTARLKRVEKKKEDAEEKLTGQVVDIPEPEKESQPPEKPKYLSRHNTQTEKE